MRSAVSAFIRPRLREKVLAVLLLSVHPWLLSVGKFVFINRK